MTSGKTFPVLRKPPIIEVVCGVHFDALELDGMVLGVYWDRRRDEFPTRHLQPAFSEGPGFVLGSPPLRAVLVGSDKVHVLQLQHDRFFMNWRAIGAAYPRFSNREAGPGLMTKALEEFRLFSDFCEERFGRRPTPTRIELAKIDKLIRGKHWRDLDDLSVVLALAGTFGDPGHHGTREFALRFVEREDPTDLIVAVNSITEQPGELFNAVRIETRAVTPVAEGDLEAAFRQGNHSVNSAFFKLITDRKRFEPEGDAG
ncbi:MAG: hypothetical protein KC731_04435 [Myxococcales bacterium]|nr:hypothetical protein [Myxococcales bacterium]